MLIVDACLDCIHRLFEYGHIGSTGEDTDIILDEAEGTLDEIVSLVCGCLEVKEEEVYLRMVQTLLTAATRTKSGLHHGTLLAAVRTVYNIYLNAREPGVRTTARVCITQILSLVFSRMEAESTENISTGKDVPTVPAVQTWTADSDPNKPTGNGVDVPRPSPPVEEGGDASVDFASVLQKDSYLLFRALCKISAKDVPEGATPDSVGLRSKLLSLELLRSLVSDSGPAFRTGERFIYALRQYLAPSLLTNSMSSAMPVVDVSLDIFELLLRKETLRPLLKTEIGAIFQTVIFRFLESPTAGPARHRKAVGLLHRLAGDHQTLADLFLNYDCDMDSPNIFEHIVSALSSAAEKNVDGSGSAVSTTGALSGQMGTRATALAAVVLIVRSLRSWSKPIEDETLANGVQSTNGTNGLDPESSGELVDGNESGDTEANSSDMANGLKSTGERSLSHEEISKSNSFLGRVSEGSDRDTSRFEAALRLKRVLAEGISKFNAKPKSGVEHLISNGRLARDPKTVAEFLQRTEHLDATMIGEYLGDSDPFAVSVMHAYTDIKDFAGLPFDSALRMHLSGFRLPGESQKIDRVMEKFASRFCACNPDIFANADAAYVLAYSVIMLHTDAHNATIKNKMSKEEFIRNNRGINDGGDLDPKLLAGLYDRITTNEIKLSRSLKDSAKDSAAAAASGASTAMSSLNLDPAQRAKEFKEESERLMAQTRVLFANRRKNPEDYTYYSATNVYHSRLMFESACFPVLAALSLLLEEASPEDGDIVALCLEGFRNGIAIASTFSMSTAKDAFVSSLAKFTHLNSISEMREKNMECVRMILAIAALEGNNLSEQWLIIVRAISQLEQIRALAAGNPGKYLLLKSPLLGSPSKRRSAEAQTMARAGSGKPGKISADGNPIALRRVASASSAGSKKPSTPGSSSSSLADIPPYFNVHLDPKVASLASSISESEIERIFTNSSTLSAQGVTDFCGALCAVSLEELGEKYGPRLFCLQKIVELAYYNMDSRTRLEWGKIWGKMGPFFASAMCHGNNDVAMYAIDSLRQLASKFLDKEELSNFSFQRAFLKPFEVCFSKSKSVGIRELVLTCISQIVLARAANIKSGWKSVFSVLGLSADDKAESIMNFGFDIAQSIVDKYLAVYDDVFVDAVNGISAFARASKSSTISFAAINLLCNKCASTLSDGKALSRIENGASEAHSDAMPNGVTSEIMFCADVEGHVRAWFPLLTGLAAAMQDDREAIRVAASDGLFRVLEEYGGRFSPGFWVLVFRGVISPIFDDVRYLSNSEDKTEAAAISTWASTMGASCLRSLVDVFVRHIEVTRDLLPDLLELLRAWVSQESESVAREGMGVLARLIMMSGDLLVENDWRTVVNGVKLLFEDTMPHEIIGPKGLSSADNSNEGINSLDDTGAEKSEISGTANGSADAELDNQDEISPQSNSGTEANGNGDKSGTVKIDFRVVRSKCVVQLLLIQLVQDAVVSFYLKLSTAHIHELGEALRESYSFAQKFNANVELRYSLWRAGFMNQVPNLLKQETSGLTTYLRIMFWLYLDASRTDCGDALETNVVDLCDRVLKRYISNCEKSNSKADDRREVAALTPVVILIVNGMMQMSTEQFEKHLGNLYDILLQLIEGADDRKVRREVCRLLRARIGPHLRGFAGKKVRPAAVSVDEITPVDVEKHNNEPEYTEYIAKPQIPGPVRELVFAVEGEDNAEGVELQVQNALSKLSGVRSATVNMEQGIARVTSSTPDDLLLSTVENVPKVRSVFLVHSTDSPLLVG